MGLYIKLFILMLLTSHALAADRHVFGPKVDTHLIPSKYVNQTFEIHVMVPPFCKHCPEKLPVLYVTDADAYFGAFSIIAAKAIIDRVVPPFILVGIGYPGDIETSNVSTLRMRDLLNSSKIDVNRYLEYLALHPSAHSSDVLKASKELINFGKGAPQFLDFIGQELIPFVDKTYPTKTDDRAYYGFSAGAQFGLYTIINKSDTFSRYIIGSSYIEGIEKKITEIGTSNRTLNAKVFLGIGGDEAFTQDKQFVGMHGYYEKLVLAFRSGISGLQFSHRIFPDETHATAWNPLFSYGIREIYNPKSCKPYLLAETCGEPILSQ